jgi:hypothetical protein
LAVFALESEMMHHLNKNKRNNNHPIATATTLFILATIIVIVSSMANTATVEATTTSNTTTTTTTTTAETTPPSSSSSGIELSPQPIYQERSSEANITPINQTHATLTFSGNGMLTLPNTTETINTTSNGTGVISFMTSSGYAKMTIRTQDGETATATLYEIVHFNSPAAGIGKGIVTAVFQTNSTGMLAPLNGMIAAGIDDMTSSGESRITLWRWESGILPLSTNTTTTTSMEESPPSP